MTRNPDINVVKAVAGLSAKQIAALTPFTVFSDVDGRVLSKRGLLIERDGVWFHTPLGQAARDHLAEARGEPC